MDEANKLLRTVAVLSVLASLVGSSAHAQSPPASSLTLQAAIERALAANPTIAAARLTGAVTRAGLAVAAERPNPEASVEIEKETPKQSFGVAVPLELGGKRAKRIALGQATLVAGDADVAATVAQVRNDVRRAYYDLLVADARFALLQGSRDLAVRARDTAQTRFDAGDAPRLEVLQAGLTVAAADNEALAAQSVTAASRTRLNALLGQPLDSTMQLTTALEVGDAVSADAMSTRALAGSTELAALDRRIDEQRARLSLAQALRVPDITPTATLTHDSEPEFTYGWRAGVAVTLPIFTTHKAGVVVEEATLAQLVAARQAASARISAEVNAAAVSAEAQRQAYVRYRDQILPQADQVERLAQDSYQLGQTGLAALLQALQSSRDVRLRALDAIAQFHTSLADLERAIGAPLP